MSPDVDKNQRKGSGTGYSITWSARSRSVCGIVKPRALAVFRLITSSNFVGCSTGSSAGFAHEYQRLSAMPIDMPPARFVAAEPGMSRKPRRS